MTRIHGQNRTLIEESTDRVFIAQFDCAETKYGFSTGMRTKLDGGGLVVLQVSPTFVYGPHRALTQEEWNATRDFLL
jgi:hypothetical protein